jgi:hypothetical protein
VLAAVALTMLPGAPALRAQGAEFSIGGGVAVPLGDFDDVVKMGWQGTAAVSLWPRSVPVGIHLDGSFSRFGAESPLDIHSQLIYGTVDAVYRFASSKESSFRPYLIGGGGIYNSKETGSDALGGSNTKFGVNGGAGFDVPVGGAVLFLEGRFHDVFVEGPNLRFFPINVGVRFGD